MRLNNWSIAASYDTARIFAGFGFGASTASSIVGVARVASYSKYQPAAHKK
jgi:hypothetical protein